MLLFGHLGLTYAAAAAVDKAGLGEKLDRLDMQMDYRFVFIGSILPDIIDKITINLIGDGSFHSGRIFAHSLPAILLMTGAGLLLWKKDKRLRLATLGLCSLVHLLLDSMWLYPNTLFWPFYDIAGLQPGESIISALLRILDKDFNTVSLLSIRDALLNPFIGIPELIGFIISGFLFIRLVLKKKLWIFVKTGRTA